MLASRPGTQGVVPGSASLGSRQRGLRRLHRLRVLRPGKLAQLEQCPAQLDPVARHERRLACDLAPVHVRSVERAQILDRDPALAERDDRVATRDLLVCEMDRGGRVAADHGLRAQRERAPLVRPLDDEQFQAQNSVSIQSMELRSSLPTVSTWWFLPSSRMRWKFSWPAWFSAIHSLANSPDWISERICFIASRVGSPITRLPRVRSPYSAVFEIE